LGAPLSDISGAPNPNQFQLHEIRSTTLLKFHVLIRREVIMYTSTRVVMSSPVVVKPGTRFAKFGLVAANTGIAAALLTYLVACIATALARRAGAVSASYARVYVRPQRRNRRFLITAGAFAVAIALGISAGGSSLALWNATKPIGAVSLMTGSTGITVNGVTNYTVAGLTTTQLLPGLSAVSPQLLTIVNTGTTPLSVAVGTPVYTDPTSLLAQNSNLIVGLFQSTTCAQTVDGSGTALMTAPVVLAAGASFTACLQMTLNTNAPSTVQGLSATFTIPLVGTQTRNNS
jgi:hypothetical protein